MSALRSLVALLAFGTFAVHALFMWRAYRERDFRGWRLRIIRLLLNLGTGSGLAGIVLSPDTWHSWLWVALMLACGVADVWYLRLEHRMQEQSVGMPADAT